jgi:GMP synthase (glutamine-hydrolysing)
MRPFLLIQTRVDDDLAADELRSTRELGGFSPAELAPLRLEAADSPVDWERLLHEHSGVILGGSPFNATDADKSPLQIRTEAHLNALLDLVVDRDHPFLGACYGISTLGIHQGGVVDRTHGEPASAVTITLTPEGQADPLCAGLPPRFEGFVGHKEAMSALPPNAALLASGEDCPVQMFRIGTNLYATQFHPELDAEGLVFRLSRYQNEGYFAPGQYEAVVAAARASTVTGPARILQNFKRRYAR